MPRALYYIAVVPPERIRKEVKELKLEMKKRYGAAHALKSPAHITLQMPFRWEPEQQYILCELLREFAANQKAFTVQLNGFDCFAPRVIFLKVEDHKPFLPFQSSLQTVLMASGIISEPARYQPFHPHMTIATRDLSPEAFEKAWPEYREKSFEGAFQVQSIFLLKHNGRHWDILDEFSFPGVQA